MTGNKQQETLSLGTIFLCLFGIPILYYLVYPIAVKTFYKYTAPGPDEIVQIYLCTKMTSEIKYSNPGKSTAFNLADNCAEAIQFDVRYENVRYGRRINKVVGSFALSGYFGDENSLPVTDKRRFAYHPDWENIRVMSRSVKSDILSEHKVLSWKEVNSTPTRTVEHVNYEGYRMRKIVHSHIVKSREGKENLVKTYVLSSPPDIKEYSFTIGGGCHLPKALPTNRCKVRDQYQNEFPYFELWWSLNPEYLEIWPEKRRRIVEFFEPLYRDESGQIKYVDVQVLRESGVIRN